MSRIVNAPMPDSCTMRAPRGRRAQPHEHRARRRRSSAAGPHTAISSLGTVAPSTSANGMPWMLPLGLVSGVLMSACASNQIRPICSPRARWCAEARRSCPSRPSGRRPARRASPAAATSPTRSRSQAAHREDLVQVLEPGIAGALRLLELEPRHRPSRRTRAERLDARVDPGDAHRARPHVDAAPAPAQVERHADQGHTRLRHGEIVPPSR